MEEFEAEIENQSDEFEIGGDLRVRRLGFGAMRVTGEDILGEPEDLDEAKRVLETAVDIGVDFFDTADSYGPGTSERLMRESLAPYDDVVVATKGGLLRNPDGDWIRHADPDYLTDAVLSSLDRLGVDEIDLYQLHRNDPDVDFGESLSALAELKDEGYVNHLGVSEVTVDELEEARDHVDVATVQNRYNVNDREHDDVLELCEDEDIGFIPWFPLGAGNLDGNGDLQDVAEKKDATTHQIALAWLLERSPVVLPIPGTSSLEHLRQNVAASGIHLSDEQMRKLNTSS